MVVFPAASRPTIRMRISFLPHSLSNSFENVRPMMSCDLCEKEVVGRKRGWRARRHGLQCQKRMSDNALGARGVSRRGEDRFDRVEKHEMMRDDELVERRTTKGDSKFDPRYDLWRRGNSDARWSVISMMRMGSLPCGRG